MRTTLIPESSSQLAEIHKRLYALEHKRSGVLSPMQGWVEQPQPNVETRPPPPTALVLATGEVAEGTDVFYVSASWTAPVAWNAKMVVGYLVELLDGAAVVQSAQVSGLSHRFTGVRVGTTYTVRVSSVSSIPTYSNTITANILVVGDVTPPAVPTGLAVAAAFRTLTATWNENTEPDVKNGRGAYDVQIATDSGFTANLRTVRVTGTIATFADLSTGTTYWVRVRAVDDDGNSSAYTAGVSATTAFDAGAGAAPPVPTGLTPTTGLDANTRDAWVNLTWTDPAPGAGEGTPTIWFVRWKRTTDTVYQYATANAKPFRILGLMPGAAYHVAVAAGSATGGQSGYTADSLITAQTDTSAPATPTGLAVGAGFKSVTATWTENTEPDVKNGNGYYEIQRATDSGFTANVVTKKLGSTVGGWSDLATGTTYWVRVRAVDSSGNPSAYTAGVSATTSQVQTADYANLSVVNAAIANLAVDTAKMTDLAVTTAKIADLNVTTAKIANLAVNNAKINDVAAGKITAGTISVLVDLGAEGRIDLDGANNIIKIFDAQGAPVERVSLGKLAAGATDYGIVLRNSAGTVMFSSTAGGASSSGIQNDAVGTTQIANLAVTNGKIAALAVDDAKINNVSAGKITTSTLTATVTVTGKLLVPGSGWRVELGDATYPIRYWDGTTTRMTMDNAGNLTLTNATITAGTFRTAASGRRIEINASANVDRMLFYDGTFDTAGMIAAADDDGGVLTRTLRLIPPRASTDTAKPTLTLGSSATTTSNFINLTAGVSSSQIQVVGLLRKGPSLGGYVYSASSAQLNVQMAHGTVTTASGASVNVGVLSIKDVTVTFSTFIATPIITTAPKPAGSDCCGATVQSVSATSATIRCWNPGGSSTSTWAANWRGIATAST